MAEYLLSDFYGFQGECVQKEILEEVDKIDLKNAVENIQNSGEKICGDDGKRKQPEYQSQAGSKKLKTEEEDPENTCIDDLPNELLQLIMKNLEIEDVMTAGQTCRRWFSVGDLICQQKAEEIEASWKIRNYVPTPADVSCASLLAAHGHLPRQVITTKAEEIEASWSYDDNDDRVHSQFKSTKVIFIKVGRGHTNDDDDDDYIPSPAEVHCASSLADHGHLPRQVITNMADKIAKALDYPSLAEVQCGAALATLGYITQLERLWLYDLDISLVPAEDLRSLVTCSAWVTIYRVTGDLSTVLSNVQSRMLDIVNTRLSTADTQQLVAAMETSVMSVVLDSSVTLDMETLAQYDGTGECEEVIMMWDTRKRYRSQVKVWAENMGWRVEEDGLWNSTRLIPL